MYHWRKIFVFWLFVASLLGSFQALAGTYRQALDAYSDQNFNRSYRKAVILAREESGVRRGKALILAAAAVLELDREERARSLFRKALDEDPDLELPDVVKSKRALRFFADIRDGKDRQSGPSSQKFADHGTAFDQVETYLPLGFNQMLQEKYILGLSLGAGQALALFNAYAKTNSAQKMDAKLQTVTLKANRTGNDINPVFKKFVSDSKSDSKKARSEAQLSLLLAFGLYTGSVLEAGYNPPAQLQLGEVSVNSLKLYAVQDSQNQWQLDLLQPLSAHPSLRLSWTF